MSGGRVALGGESLGTLEGPPLAASAAHRTAVLEFPTEAAARAWYASDAYQQAITARHDVASMTLTLVQGG